MNDSTATVVPPAQSQEITPFPWHLSKSSSWRRFINRCLGREVSKLSRYCDQLVQVAPRDTDSGALFSEVDAPRKTVVSTVEDAPDVSSIPHDRSLFLLNGNFNHHLDIEGLLRALRVKCSRGTRVVAVSYNPYLRWLYSLANRLGLRQGEQPTTFVTAIDLNNMAKLAGFEVVRLRPVAYVPWELGGLGDILNQIFSVIPVVRWLALATVVVLRPVIVTEKKPSISVVIPARNEKGNIEAAMQRMPWLGGQRPEVIFVEGNSTDDTWEEIQRVRNLYADRFSIQTLKQTGKGKADAVRLGFSKASGDLLVILDADLTMPPELLGRFYEAYARGLADFVNGSRLVYPMEGQAMKFLNRLGNIFFAKALSAVLETKLGDSLCGTKLMARRDYERFCAWRKDFGDFDPFGDFELLFPAALLGLGVVDVPIRYRDRVYGSTNIRRFYHGWMLLRMTAIGLWRVRLG